MTIADQIYEKLKAARPEVVRVVMDFLEFLEAKRKAAHVPPAIDTFAPFFGLLKDSKAFAGDPVEIQRQMRAEWDREWDK